MRKAYCSRCGEEVRVVVGRCAECGTNLPGCSSEYKLKIPSLTVGQLISILVCVGAMITLAIVLMGMFSNPGAALFGAGGLVGSIVSFLYSSAMWIVFSHVKKSIES